MTVVILLRTLSRVYISSLLILFKCQVLMNDYTEGSEVYTVSVLIWMPFDESHSGVFCIRCR
jgi:hypothetical protein